MVENADTETTLERIIPRRSIARTEGLDKAEDPLRLGSSAVVVMETGTRKVLFQKNDSAVLPMASITKLMTGVVVAEAKLPMDESITITEDDVDNERHSRSRLKVGITLTRSEALHLALMSSENRAAHALGRTFPGGLPAFIPAMNAKAKQLGMTQTTYVDPTGLSDRNRATARDLATLVEHAAHFPMLREYSTDPHHQTALGNRNLLYKNSNRLVKSGAWEIDLQKTGYIVEAGHCVVMQTKVAGRDLVMVLLDAQSNGRRNADAERLRRWLGGAPAPVLAQAEKSEPQRTTVRKVAQSGKATSKAERRVAKASARAEKKVADKSRTQTHKASGKNDARVRKSFAGQVESGEKLAGGRSGSKG